MKITYRRVNTLSDGERATLHAIFLHSADATRAAFEAGIDKLDELFIVQEDDKIAGFGGVRVLRISWMGVEHRLIFTGRVCLSPALRGRNIIQRVGLRYYLQQRREAPACPVYWLYGAGTWHSYLVLARNFSRYWPHPYAELPTRERALLDAACAALQAAGIDARGAHLHHPSVVFTEGNAALDRAALADPQIAFYASLNPEQAHGVDLLCLAPLNAQNWSCALSRAALRALRPRRGRDARPHLTASSEQ